MRLQVGRRLDEVRRADHPADPPAGHRVGLGDAVDDHAVVGELGAQHRHRAGLDAVVDQVLVDLVGEHPQAVLLDPAADRLDLVGGVDRAGRVGRGAEQQHLGALGARGLELLDGDLVVLGLVGEHLDGHAAGEPDRLGVGRPVRRRHDHLVARVEHGGEGRVDRLLAAVGDQHLRRLDGVARCRAGSSRRSPASARAARRPGCSGGCAGRGRPRPRPRRCSPGVGKSGSPAPKPITGRPSALSALALASTLSVADSAMRADAGGDAAVAVGGGGRHGHEAIGLAASLVVAHRRGRSPGRVRFDSPAAFPVDSPFGGSHPCFVHALTRRGRRAGRSAGGH